MLHGNMLLVIHWSVIVLCLPVGLRLNFSKTVRLLLFYPKYETVTPCLKADIKSFYLNCLHCRMKRLKKEIEPTLVLNSPLQKRESPGASFLY